MAYIVEKETLPGNATSRQFEGYLHNGANVSFFISSTPPGRGPGLHTHPYEEIFIVQAGTLTFTVGDETLEVSTEAVVVVLPGTPHKFTNTGDQIAHHVDVHTARQMQTTWLEE